MTYRLHPEAALEHEEQVAYYEKRSAGLGLKYHGAMLKAVGMAVEAPHRLRLARPPDIRQVGLLGFQFTLIYREMLDQDSPGRISAMFRKLPDGMFQGIPRQEAVNEGCSASTMGAGLTLSRQG